MKDIADAIGGKIVGDGGVEVEAVASIGQASPGDLIFVEDEKHLAMALSSNAGVVIAGEFSRKSTSAKPLIIASNPRLAFTRAAKLLRQKTTRSPGIHSSAVVLPSASVDRSAVVDPWVFIGENATVGRATWVGPGAVIGSGSVIGDDCRIHPRVTIYPGTRIGNRVVIHAGAVLGSDGFGYVTDPDTGKHENFPQTGSLVVEDDVEIGANTTIDRGALEITRIGRGTKIDNLVHIGHNCQIGDNVLIAAQAGFSGSISIGDNAVIGGQVGIGEHAHIEEGVLLGGQAGVLPKKILRGKGIIFWGTPAKPVREYLRQLAQLANLGGRTRRG